MLAYVVDTYSRRVPYPIESNSIPDFYRVLQVLKNVKYKDWELVAEINVDCYHPVITINVNFTAIDVETGKPGRFLFNGYRFDTELFKSNSDDFIVEMAFRTIKEAELHEVAEHFFYRNTKIYDPHRNEVRR